VFGSWTIVRLPPRTQARRRCNGKERAVMFVFRRNPMKVDDDVMVHDDDAAPLTRPRRHAVHLLPHDRRFSCRRCDEIAAAGTSDAEEQRAAA
jgi:hypothetical protein